MFTFLREIPGEDTHFAANWTPKDYLMYHSSPVARELEVDRMSPVARLGENRMHTSEINRRREAGAKEGGGEAEASPAAVARFAADSFRDSASPGYGRGEGDSSHRGSEDRAPPALTVADSTAARGTGKEKEALTKMPGKRRNEAEEDAGKQEEDAGKQERRKMPGTPRRKGRQNAMAKEMRCYICL
jgi:hypothetical protein